MEHTQTPKDYARPSCRVPRPWNQRRQLRHGLPQQPCLAEVPTEERRVRESIVEIVREMRGEAFVERVGSVRPGREQFFFAQSAVTARLVRAIRSTSDAKDVIERQLDELFEDYRTGEVFAHAEVVMAILFALKAAEMRFFGDIAGVFATSETVEIGRVRRFARALLAQ